MPILTPEQKATLAAELAKPEYAGLTPGEIAVLLNAATRVSSGPAPQVPAPIDEIAVINAISQASAQKLVDSGYIDRLVTLLQTEDRSKLPLSIALLVKSGHLQPAEAAGLGQMMSSTIDDPNHPDTVPGPSKFQQLFGNTRFTVTSGDGLFLVAATSSGTCLPEMIVEALS